MKITKSYLRNLIQEALTTTVKQEAVKVSTDAKVVGVEEKGRDMNFTIMIGGQKLIMSFSKDGGSPLYYGDADYYEMTQPEQDAIWEALRNNPKYASFKAEQDAEAMEKYFGKGKNTPVHETEHGSKKLEKEAWGRRGGYRSGGYGGGYGSSYRKEEDPDWHARPGEEFTVPGQAYIYFTLTTAEGKDQPMRRKFSYYSSRSLPDKEMEVEQALMDKYSEANKGSNEGMVFKSIGKTEIISKPHKVEN